jgi:predicted site-specific integrase-resolvase
MSKSKNNEVGGPVSSLYRPNEAADFLGLKVGTLAVWRSVGRYDLPYTKVGRYVRYRETDLVNFLNSRMRTHTG